MKAGWLQPRLGDVCRFDKNQAIHSDLPYVGLEHIESDTAQFIGSLEPTNVKSSTFKFTSKHILYGRLRPYLNKVLTPDFDGHCSTEIFPIVPAPELMREFLRYWLQSKEIVTKINATCTGARMPRADMNEVLNFTLPLPPLPEQQRIVAILDEAFAAIAAARANAEQNRQNACALFESYLQSVFSQRGEGWVEKTLGDLCDLYQGLCINAKTKHLLVESSNLPLLRIKDLRDNSSEQYVAEVGWPKNAFVTESEIIYTRTGQIGLVFRGRRGVLHNNCFKVTPSNELNGDYLFWWLQNPTFRARITTLASKAAQPDISHALFKIQPICLPPRSYQDQAIPLINQVHEETQRLESLYQRKIAALDELKQSLLQQAFSGQL